MEEGVDDDFDDSDNELQPKRPRGTFHFGHHARAGAPRAHAVLLKCENRNSLDIDWCIIEEQQTALAAWLRAG